MAGTNYPLKAVPSPEEPEREAQPIGQTTSPTAARLDSREAYIEFCANIAKAMLTPLEVWKSELEHLSNSENQELRELAMDRARQGMGANALIHAKEARSWFAMAVSLESFPTDYERHDAEKLKANDIQELSAEELRELINSDSLRHGLAQARASIKQRKRERAAHHHAEQKHNGHARKTNGAD